MSFKLDASDFFAHLDVKERNVAEATEEVMEKSIDDLLRIATNIAPISLSTLRKSGKNRVAWGFDGIFGEVWFSATESSSYGRFNYAIWTHEMTYNLGEKSAQAPGADGYAVGNKYVERPLKGESAKYRGWWASKVRSVLD